ncbi:pyridoxamine 5'-phosphate oxidase family protein [Mangrovimonas sp. DI 80]|uniref:pyridoxamine 5'-phosphate oxidase family protein n=1 Tax=Mangrovimonas sp. DI 80 TaxID=1779330 RepID=UPI000975A1C8|nr:pyridoxamine 5'-phosphate oxidase family protein [Mangrovimonas sp. DI 80]OMP29891.1 flavin mononucleotide-binding protein [Mangrovimonas sp. DI 80]
MIKTLNQKECYMVLERNYIGHLAYMFYHQPFIAPITYFYDTANHWILAYAAEGHKINAMRKHRDVALQVEEVNSVNEWKSVLVHGTYEELTGSYAKAQLHSFSLGVKDLIMMKEHKDVDFLSEFSSKIHLGDVPVVYVIKIDAINGKQRDDHDS